MRQLRRLPWSFGLLMVVTLFGSACCGRAGQRGSIHDAGRGYESDAASGDHRVMRGEASYYADFFAGRKTANGERYDPNAMTAANRTLPLGTKVRIRRIDNGRSVVVRVNDRGPFGKRRRIFDLSKAAAKQLDMLHAGRAEVEAVVLD